MKIDYLKCKEVILKLNDYFDNSLELAGVEYPANVILGSNEYFIYMFYSCLLDYGMRSSLYHKNLNYTYMKYPNIFVPKFVCEIADDDLKKIIINNIHPRYPNVATKKWLELSKELVKYNSISDHLRNIKSITELNEFIRNIKGYGQKTGGLLIRIICDSKICSFEDNIKAIPIDRHDIEISYLTGVINLNNISNTEIDDLSDAYVSVGEELGINPSVVDKYLWEIGNSFCNKKKCELCPLNNVCLNTKKVKNYNK